MATAVEKPQLPNLVQPTSLGTDEGNLYLVVNGLYLAMRAAERGDQVGADQTLGKAFKTIEKINDASVRAQANGYYDAMASYVDSLAPNAKTLALAAATSDAQWKDSQVLSAAQAKAFSLDNADLQRAYDAIARGESADLAYHSGYVARQAAESVSAVSTAAANVVGAALSPWKWWLAGAAVVLAVAGTGYAYFLRRAASRVGV